MQNGFVDLDAHVFSDELLKQWYPKIRAFARKIKVNIEFDDLVQDLTLHFIKISQKYRFGKSEFTTFAWTCLKNKARNILKEARQSVVGILPEEYSWENVEFNLDILLTRGLKRKHKFILLALGLGYKKKEIAKRLKVTESRVSGLIVEIRERTNLRRLVDA